MYEPAFLSESARPGPHIPLKMTKKGVLIMADFNSSICITSVARTAAELLGVEAPAQSAPAIGAVKRAAEKKFGAAGVDRVLLYNPDAIALWLYQKYTGLFEPAICAADMQLPMLSVMPSVTPVCFASMYTGVMPEIHGIRKYEKPVLKQETLFDALIRAGKKPAIVSTAGDSISTIFLERNMDYFIYDTPEECNQKAMELIEKDEYDLIAFYNGNYDATMHRFAPESKEALDKLAENARVFAALEEAVKKHWAGHRTLLGYCPDHGCHEIDGGLGSHGLDMPEDMNVVHMFALI